MKARRAKIAARRTFLAALMGQRVRQPDDPMPVGDPSRVSLAVRKMKRIQLSPVLPGPGPRSFSG